MPSLTITKTYDDGLALTEAMLDGVKDSIETFINVTKLDNANIQSGGIATTNLADNAVTEAKLNTSVAGSGLTGGGGTALAVNVDNSTLEVSADVVRVKDSGVTTAKLLDNAVTTAKITDANVTTAKLANASVTQAKLGAVNMVTSSACSSFSSSSAGYVGVTNLSVTITTTGRPVELFLRADASGGTAFIALANGTASTATGVYAFARDSAFIDGEATVNFYGPALATSLCVPVGGFRTIDSPGAGTYTYAFAVKCTLNSTWNIANVKLVAREV